MLEENFCHGFYLTTTGVYSLNYTDIYMIVLFKQGYIPFNSTPKLATNSYKYLVATLKDVITVYNDQTFQTFNFNSYSDGIYLRGWGNGNVVNADGSKYRQANPNPTSVGVYAQARFINHIHIPNVSSFAVNIADQSHVHTFPTTNYGPHTNPGGNPQTLVPTPRTTSGPLAGYSVTFVDNAGNPYDFSNFEFVFTQYDVRTNPYNSINNIIWQYPKNDPATGFPPLQGGINVNDLSPVTYYTKYIIKFN